MGYVLTSCQLVAEIKYWDDRINLSKSELRKTLLSFNFKHIKYCLSSIKYWLSSIKYYKKRRLRIVNQLEYQELNPDGPYLILIDDMHFTKL